MGPKFPNPIYSTTVLYSNIYSMDDHADDILYSFCLIEEKLKVYKSSPLLSCRLLTPLLWGRRNKGYHLYDCPSNILERRSLTATTYIKQHNIIFKRARFNVWKQEPGESVDTFITALYELAEHCSHGELHDEMIRDQIVVSIKVPNFWKSYSWMTDRKQPFSLLINQKSLSNSKLYFEKSKTVEK